MSPRQGKLLLRLIASVACVFACLAAFAQLALADESPVPTTQAVAYNADWVPYLDPPARPAAVCLVDSGVNVTPDTPADSPDGPIVKRLALDGGPGTAASPTWEGLHGTRMAFVGGAPINGWGAVGFWPGVRIVSIRAVPMGETTFPFDDYSRAMALCRKWSSVYPLAVVNLSLGCDCVPTVEERARLEDEIALNHGQGLSIVAAAGNSGGPVGSPAKEPGILAVAAGSNVKALCPFSSRGADVDVLAPGCEVDLADPASGLLWSGYQSGTSGASMTISVVLALLRSYLPSATWQTAEHLLESSGHASPNGAVLDVEAIFRAAGLGHMVDAAKARVPQLRADAPGAALAPPTDATAAPPTTRENAGGIALDADTRLRRVLVAPRVKSVIRRGDRVRIVVLNRPRRARLVVSIERRISEFGYVTDARISRYASRLSLRFPRRNRRGRVVLRYESARPEVSSRPTYHRIPR